MLNSVPNNLSKIAVTFVLLFSLTTGLANALYVDTGRDFNSNNNFSLLSQVSEIRNFFTLREARISNIASLVKSTTHTLPKTVAVAKANEIFVFGDMGLAKISTTKVALSNPQTISLIGDGISKISEINIGTIGSKILGQSPRTVSSVGGNLSLFSYNGNKFSALISNSFSPKTFSINGFATNVSDIVTSIPRVAMADDLPKLTAEISLANNTGSVNGGMVLGVFTSAIDANQKNNLPFLDQLSLSLYCSITSFSSKLDDSRCNYDLVASGIINSPVANNTVVNIAPTETKTATSSVPLTPTFTGSKSPVYITQYVTKYVAVPGPKGEDGVNGRDGRDGSTATSSGIPAGFGSYAIPSLVSPSSPIGISTIGYLRDTTIEHAVINYGTSTNMYLANASLSNATFNGSNLFNGYATFTGNVAINDLTATTTTLTNATTTNGYTANLSAGTSTFSGSATFGSDVSIAGGLSVTGTTTLATTTATDATISNLTATNSTTTNSFISSLLATLANITGLTVTNSTTTDAVITNSTTTNAYITTLTADNLSVGTSSANSMVLSGTLTVGGTTTLATTSVSDITINNATSTSLFSTLLTAVTGFFTDLTATNATLTNATSSNLFATTLNAITSTINTLTGGSITATSSLTSNGTLNVTGQTTLGNASSTGLTATNLYFTNASSTGGITTTNIFGTNIFASSSVLTLASSTGLTATNLYSTQANITNASTTGVTATNIFSTNIFASSSVLTLASSTGITATNFYSTNATLTNASSSALTATNLYSTLANITNASTTGVTATNIFSTNIFASSSVLTLASSTGLTATNLYVTNSVITNASSTGVTTTNLVATNATTTLLAVTGTSTLATTTASNITVTGQTTLGQASTTGISGTGLSFTNGTITNASSTALSASGATFGDTNTTGTTNLTGAVTASSTLAVTGESRFYSTLNLLADLLPTTDVTRSIGSNALRFLNLFSQNIYASSSVLTNSTSTNAFATNLSATNAILTNASSTGLTATNLYSTDAVITNASTTNLSATGLTVTNSNTIGTATINNASTTNLSAEGATITNGTITNASSTALSASGATFGDTNTTGTTNLTGAVTASSTLAVTGESRFYSTLNLLADLLPTTDVTRSIGSNALRFLNLFSQNIYASSSVVTNATSSNLFATTLNAITSTINTLTGGSITATSSLTSNGTLNVTGQTTLGNASSTGLTATDLYSTNATSTNLFTTSLGATNAFISGGLGVGVATTAPGVIQTSGNVLIGGSLTVAGSLTSSITNGQIQFLATPFGTNISEGTVFINPASAGTNNVLLGLAVNGTEKARIDAEGDVQIVGTYNSTNVSGTNALSGHFSVGGNTTLGTNASNTVAINGRINTNVIPNADATYDLGSPSNRFGTLYVTATNIENLAIEGVSTSTFLINSDNGTFDTEDAALEFSRGSSTPNARIKWNATLDQFEFNDFLVNFANVINVSGTGTSTIAGMLNLTKIPAGSGLHQGSLYINPSSGSTDSTLLGIGVNGVERLRVDAEGDTTIQASLGIQNALYNISGDTVTVNDKLQINSNEIKDSTGTTRLTIGSANTVTGSLGVTGALGASSTLAVTGESRFYSTLNLLADLLPTTDVTRSIGSNALRFLNLFSQNIYASSSVLTNSTSTNAFATNLSATNAILTNASSTGLTATNLYSTIANLGAITGTSLNISGQTTLANASSTGLTVTGGAYLATSAGGVGIGTTNPSAKLHVVGGASQYAGMFQSDQTPIDWVNTFGTFNLVNANSTTNNHSIISFSDTVGGASSAGLGVRYADRSNDYGDLYFYTKGADGYNQRVYIQSNGNVGIGSTTPGYKLSVVGGGYFGGNVTATGTLNVTGNTTLVNASTTVLTAPTLFFTNASGTAATIPTLYGTTGSFTTFTGTNASTTNLTVANNAYFGGDTGIWNSSGSVGVGTTNPDSRYKLQITNSGGGEGAKMGVIEDKDYTGIEVGESTAVSGGLYWRNSLNRLEFATVGHDYPIVLGDNWIYLNTNGNVGIGTTTPAAKFAVNGDSYFGGNVTATGTLNVTGNTTLVNASTTGVTATNVFTTNLYASSSVITNGSSTGYTSTNLYATLLNTTGTTTLATSGGNVGIGTTAPNTPLQVLKTSAGAVSNILTLSNGNGNDNTGARLSFNMSTDPTFSTAYIEAVRSNLTTGGATYMAFGTSNASNGLTTEKLRISEDGNVGIGTTTPTAKLVVNGTGASTGINFLATDSSAVSKFSVYDNGFVSMNGVSLNFGGNVAGAPTAGAIYNNSGTSILLGSNTGVDFANNSGEVFSRIGGNNGGITYFNTGGNVGIGTTTPAAKFAVNGDSYFGGNVIATGTVTVGDNTTYSTYASSSIQYTGDTFSILSNAGKLSLGNNGQFVGFLGNRAVLCGGQTSFLFADATDNCGSGGGTAPKAVGSLDSSGFIVQSGSYIGFNSIAYGTNWTKSPDTTLSRLSAGVLSIGSPTASSTGTLVVGNVGIGTTSPVSMLSVMASSTALTSPFISFNSTTSPVFNVLANGNVGIGTAAPASSLDVNTSTGIRVLSSGNNDHYVTVGKMSGAAENYEMFNSRFDSNTVLNYRYDPSFGSQHGNKIEYGARGSNVDDANYPASLEFAPRGYLGSRTALFLSNTGSVGIGTTTSSSVLGVASSTATGTTNLFSVGTSSTIFNVLANGNIGIGTDAPTSALHLGSGVFTVPTGSASSPSITFAGDTNTGIFSIVADALSFSSGGSELLRLQPTVFYNFAPNFSNYATVSSFGNGSDATIQSVTNANLTIASAGAGSLRLNPSGGNVGIGSTTPSSKLSVVGDSYFGGNVTATGTLNVTGQTTLTTASSTGLTATNLYATLANTLGTTTLATSGGNVGIGTTTPLASFHLVNPNNTGVNPIALFQSTGTNAPAIKIQGTDRSVLLSAQVNTLDVNGAYRTSKDGSGTSNGAFLMVNGNAATTYGSLGVDANANIVITQASTTQAIVLTGGNVGIGTSTPTSLLSVASSTATGTSNLFSVGTSSTIFNVLANGNVGVGTESPTSPLQVVGNIVNSGSVITGSDQGEGLFFGDLSGNNGLWRNGTYRTNLNTNGGGVIVLGNGVYDGSGSNGLFARDTNVIGFLDGNYNNSADVAISRLDVNKIGVGNGTQGDFSGTFIAGNVGIGTSTPTNSLDVVTTAGTFQVRRSADLLNVFKAVPGAISADLGGGTIAFTNNTNGITTDGFVQGNGGQGIAFSAGGPKVGTNTLGAGGFVGYGGDSTSVIWAGSGMPLVFGINGTEAFRVNSSGNVGIGTTTPTSLLSVSSSTATGTSRLFGVGTTTDIFTVLANGNVGIGTAAPEVGLSISGTGSYGLLHLVSTGANQETSMSFKSGDDSNGGGGDWLIGKNISASDDSFSIFNGGTNKFVVSTTGNVGIGTTTPSSLLQVAGTTTLGIGSSIAGVLNFQNASNQFTTTLRSSSTQATDLNFVLPNTAGTSGYALKTDGAGGMYWDVTGISGGQNGYVPRWLSDSTQGTSTIMDNGTVAGVNATSSSYSFNVQGAAGVNPFNVASSTGTSLFTVLANGNVGIGSTTPWYKLAVTGDGYFGGNLTATGTLNVTGQTTLANASTTNLTVSTNAYFGGNTGIWNSSGNVGIGTTNITNRLNVHFSDTANTIAGATAITGFNNTDTTNNNTVLVSLQGSDLAGTVQRAVAFGAQITSHATNAVSGDFVVTTSNAGTDSEKFRIMSSGNVGIGTTSPGYKLSVIGDGYFGGDITATGTLNIAGHSILATASTTGLTSSGTLNVTGKTTLGNASTTGLTSSGTLNVSGVSTLTGVVKASSTLGVTGATTLYSTLNVAGVSTLTDDVNASSTLAVTGATTLYSTLKVVGAINASSTLAVTGATTLYSTLKVGSAINASSTLGVTGATTLYSTLKVVGAINASSTLGVTGATSLYSTLDVDGHSTLTTASTTGLTSSGTLNVTGKTTLANASTTNISASTGIFAAALNVSGASLHTGLATFGLASSTGLTSTNLYATLFNTTGTTTLATSGGNVGIGTTAPYGLLTVSSANISQVWSLVGSGYSTTTGTPTLATLSPNRVAFFENTNDSLRTYEFDGSTWSAVGSGLTISTSGSPSLSALSPNRVAYVDNGSASLRAYEFNGSTWSAVGSAGSLGTVGAHVLTALSPNRVALYDPIWEALRVYEFDGSTWSRVGSSFSLTAGSAALTTLSPNRVAFIDDSNDSLSTYEFNGSTWSLVGSGLTITASGGLSLTTLSPNRVAFIDYFNDSLRTYEFNGSTWSLVGSGLTISTTGGTPAITALSPNRVAYIDSDNDSLRTYQFAAPVFTVGDSEDYPFLSVSDTGFVTAEGLAVRTTLNVGQGATATSSTSTPSFVVSGLSTFLNNVGIGTTTPLAQLSINPTFANGSTPSFFIGSSTTHLIVTSAGNVGIGTTTPSSKLTVTGDGYFEGNLATTGTLNITGVSTLTDAVNASSTLAVTGATTLYNTLNVAGHTTLATASSTGLTLGTGSSVAGRLYFANASNAFTTQLVSSSTQSANLTFTLPGTAGASGDVLKSNGSGGMYWGAVSLTGGTNGYLARWTSPSALSSGTLLDNGTVAGVNATSSSYSFNIQGAAGVNPFAVASSSGTSLFAILANGNVGVGTSTPYSRLAVSSGNISQTWSLIGSGLSISTTGSPTVASLSPNRVAYYDNNNESLRTYEFNGSTWSLIGSGLTISGVGDPAITALSPNRVALIGSVNDSLSTYEFNGSTWVQVGSGLTISNTNVPNLAALSPNRVAFFDNTNESLRTYEFNGSTWSLIGSGLSISTTNAFPALTTLSPNRVAFIDATNESLRTYEFNGSTWVQVGSGLSISTVGAPALSTLSPNRVVFIDNGNDDLRTYEFNGSTWSLIGSELNISTTGNPAITALSPNRVAFFDNTNDSLRTYQFAAPVFTVGDSEDYPFLSVSDTGFVTAEGLAVRTTLNVGQGATATSSTSTPSFVVSGLSTFLNNVGIGTTTPLAQLSINPTFANGSTPSFFIGSSTTHLIVTSTGNVGIGSTTPSSKLTVTGDGYFGGNFITTGTTTLATSGGNVGIGSTTPGSKLSVGTDVSSNYVASFFNDGNNADRYGIRIQGGADAGTGTTYYLNAFDGDGGNVGYIANTSGTFAVTDVSDIRTKTNINDTRFDATSILNDLRIVDFNRKSNPDGELITGFIAQEVQEVYSNAVTEGADGFLGIMKDAFIPILVKGFQENDKKLVALSDVSLSMAEELKNLIMKTETENQSISMFPVDEAVEYGTVVAFSTSTHEYMDKSGTSTYSVVGIRKATNGYDAIGIVTMKSASSTEPTNLDMSAPTMPVVFSGKVAVKVTSEAGIVKAGDYLTVSKTMPGYAMKMTTDGKSIGRAISDYDASRDKIMMFVENGYQDIDLASNTATTTMLTTGNVDLNANGVAIINIKSLASANGTWSIDETGRIVAKVLCLEDVCIDKTQLRNVLNSTGQSGVVAGTSTSSTGETSTSTGSTTDTTSSGTSGDSGSTTTDATTTPTDTVPPTDTTTTTTETTPTDTVTDTSVAPTDTTTTDTTTTPVETTTTPTETTPPPAETTTPTTDTAPATEPVVTPTETTAPTDTTTTTP